MDSPTDLFGCQSSLISAFDLYPNPSNDHDPPRRPTSSRAGDGAPYVGSNRSPRPPYPLIHHLLQPSGAPMRAMGQLHLDRYMGEEAEEEAERGAEVEEDEGVDGGVVREGIRGGGKRLNSDTLVADWGHDMLTVKRLRLESLVKGDGEIGLEEEEEEEERGRRFAERGNRERGREGRRREREELKEQLEEARERLKALQEKVWKVFGGRPAQEEERRSGGEEDGGIEEEEETVDCITEEEEEGGEIDNFSLSFLPSSPPLHRLAKQDPKVRDDKGTRDEERSLNGGGGVVLEGVLERAGVWMGCGVVRGEWEGFGGGGVGQKFAQALKQELGGAVARVIDRVLRLYTKNQSHPPSIHPSILSCRERGDEGGAGGGVWASLREERMSEGGAVAPDQPAPRPNEAPPPRPQALREQSEALPLVTRRSDSRRNTLLPPNSHPDNRNHNPLLLSHALPPLRQPHPARLPSHPALPPPSPYTPAGHGPLPLPLLHFTMQQLFARSLSHLPPLHKGDLMNSDPYMEGNPFPSTHAPSYPLLPLALIGGLDRLDGGMQHHHDRERDGGMRGGGGGGDGGMDSGMFLGPGSSQEGLSPCHLKKAKLMFFYARYPSSNTLKTYFPDVKFNRCVTSQLIKWFSNFREFFYIQMERFARQAARDNQPRDGVSCPGRDSRGVPLRLGRDTELYRILNMHYNKSNDYQVPERFMEVADLALREFYTAIQTGRDSDPCWKKSIYKIICKLDSPVPDSFRLPGCPIG
ncbi:prospero homeobox 3 [Esox lucius]|uniref:Prospero domain-containing protein n=1 Tax=Esox lucius TaxID=8010 RepID=A0A3P8ZS37_ESOLU|nr:prospero homeobox 3 [Esox lucius]XP_034146313.1 prospero homeobox 3 [Esox lucius]